MRYLSNFIEDRKVLTIGGVSGASSPYNTAVGALGTGSSTPVADPRAVATGMPAAIQGLDSFTLSQVAPSLDSTAACTAAWGDAGAKRFDAQQAYADASQTFEQGSVCGGGSANNAALIAAGGQTIAAMIPLIAGLF